MGMALPPAALHAHVWGSARRRMRKPSRVLTRRPATAWAVEVCPHLGLVWVAGHLVRGEAGVHRACKHIELDRVGTGARSEPCMIAGTAEH